MKNVKNILSHLFPKKQKLIEHGCLNRLVSLLPSRLKEHILFSYLKGDTVYFVVDHPAIKMEFNYNQKVINDLLNMIAENLRECSFLKGKTFVCFVSNKRSKTPKEEGKSHLKNYKEPATGEFPVYCEDKELQEIFRRIKENIKRNLHGLSN